MLALTMENVCNMFGRPLYTYWKKPTPKASNPFNLNKILMHIFSSALLCIDLNYTKHEFSFPLLIRPFVAENCWSKTLFSLISWDNILSWSVFYYPMLYNHWFVFTSTQDAEEVKKESAAKAADSRRSRSERSESSKSSYSSRSRDDSSDRSRSRGSRRRNSRAR